MRVCEFLRFGGVFVSFAWEFWPLNQALKTVSADWIVGSSRLAGVAVLDFDLLVDLPKAPDSAALRRVRVGPVGPSWLDNEVSVKKARRQAGKQARR